MKYLVEYTVRPTYRCRIVVEADNADEARRVVSDIDIDELVENRYQMDVASLGFDEIRPAADSDGQ